MREKNQKTIKSQVNFSGIGLHSGIKTNLSLRPAKANHGVVFKRVDLDKNNEILANYANVSSAKLCTKIENNFGNGVSTIEHLMAAIYICGIDNLTIEIDGPEVPIMDGSAKDFYEVISKCGSITQNEKRKFIKIIKKINLNESGKSISIEPSENNFSVDFTLSYKNPLIKTQSNKINFQEKDLENIYSARTFCLFEDIEKIKEIGLAKGGSLENAIVVKETLLDPNYAHDTLPGGAVGTGYYQHFKAPITGNYTHCYIRVANLKSMEYMSGGNIFYVAVSIYSYTEKSGEEIYSKLSNVFQFLCT